MALFKTISIRDDTKETSITFVWGVGIWQKKKVERKNPSNCEAYLWCRGRDCQSTMEI